MQVFESDTVGVFVIEFGFVVTVLRIVPLIDWNSYPWSIELRVFPLLFGRTLALVTIWKLGKTSFH